MTHAVGAKNPFLVALDTGRHPPTARATPVGDITMPEECREALRRLRDEIGRVRQQNNALQAQNEDLRKEIKNLEEVIPYEEQKSLEELEEGVRVFDNYKKEIRDVFELYSRGPQNLQEEQWLRIKNDYTGYREYLLMMRRHLERIKERRHLERIKERHMTDKINEFSDIIASFDYINEGPVSDLMAPTMDMDL
jgi:chromosome segregation ATPase